MIKNHIKIAWRNLLKNSTYSLINIIGLTIGLAACLVVTTVVIDESSYDRFWTKKDQIFRVNTINTRDGELLEKFEHRSVNNLTETFFLLEQFGIFLMISQRI